MRSIILLLAVLLPACVADPGLPQGGPSAGLPAASSALHTKAVLIAADESIVAFANATTVLRAWLQKRGVTDADIQRVGGRGPAATVDTALGAIRNIHAGPGDSCLVYITGHGLAQAGILLPASRNTLGRNDLDRALTEGCGPRPTVVVVSGCFSGTYLDGRLRRDNRIIITAARRDRPSFGCAATNRFTYFDDCLITSLYDKAVTTWEEAQASASACVVRREKQDRFVASEPQIAVGEEVGDMKLPGLPSS